MGNTSATTRWLEAEVAMRAEDTRIARLHALEAVGRTATRADRRAAIDALQWLHKCCEREQSVTFELAQAAAKSSPLEAPSPFTLEGAAYYTGRG